MFRCETNHLIDGLGFQTLEEQQLVSRLVMKFRSNVQSPTQRFTATRKPTDMKELGQTGTQREPQCWRNWERKSGKRELSPLSSLSLPPWFLSLGDCGKRKQLMSSTCRWSVRKRRRGNGPLDSFTCSSCRHI